MKKIALIGVLLVVVVGLVFSGCAAPAPTAGPIVLKAVSFLPKGASPLADYGNYIDAVNERANGELVIDWIGGPEALPRFDQAEAVRTGVIDMTATPFMDYHDLAPAGMSVFLSQVINRQSDSNRNFSTPHISLSAINNGGILPIYGAYSLLLSIIILSISPLPSCMSKYTIRPSMSWINSSFCPGSISPVCV